MNTNYLDKKDFISLIKNKELAVNNKKEIIDYLSPKDEDIFYEFAIYIMEQILFDFPLVLQNGTEKRTVIDKGIHRNNNNHKNINEIKRIGDYSFPSNKSLWDYVYLIVKEDVLLRKYDKFKTNKDEIIQCVNIIKQQWEKCYD